MAATDDLIDFDLIETHKENIQSLPSGRSAKALASLYAPLSVGPSPSPSQTQNLNDALRHEYEKELLTIDELDDPLDVYERYVRWTLQAYPSAQATPQSQLLPLLERATKAFLSSPQYKNDLRYLKFWLHYIRLFDDTPRETFAYLSRQNIGDGLALYYEEFAAWLEGAGRWSQAEEVYKLGIEKEARPVQKLLRKYKEFQHRFESRPHDAQEPTSPALPTVRPALAAKTDPFSSHAASPAVDPQARGSGVTGSKPGRQKMSIFSDTEEPPRSGSSDSSKGWDRIGSLAERRKENRIEAKPWAGEQLRTAKTNNGVPKMAIFKDERSSINDNEPNPLRDMKMTFNEKTGRYECVFVDLEAVYPSSTVKIEYCFEELRARHRGWLDWGAERRREEETAPGPDQQDAVLQVTVEEKSAITDTSAQAVVQGDREEASRDDRPLKIAIHHDYEDSENMPPTTVPLDHAGRVKKARREDRANRTKKIRLKEVHNETTKVMTNLDSPTGKKLRRKKTAEPTMTICTREAMDEIYGIFNQPLKSSQDSENESDEVSSDDDYTSGGESTTTGRISVSASDFGDTTSGDFTTQTAAGADDDMDSDDDQASSADVKSVSEWSDFTASKHVPEGLAKLETAGDDNDDDDDQEQATEQLSFDEAAAEDLVTPTSPSAIDETNSKFVPEPPEDMEVPTRPYRDVGRAAQNRLPFMTPIVEKTESSLGAATAFAQAQKEKDYFNSKTPTKSAKPDDDLWSSPVGEGLDEAQRPFKVPQPDLKMATCAANTTATNSADSRSQCLPIQNGPIIKDSRCNPINYEIKNIILNQIQPPLSSYDGYFEDLSKTNGMSAEIRKFTKAVSKVNRNVNDKTATNLTMPPVIRLAGSDRQYVVKKELGKGAFAPVYLAHSSSLDDDDDDEPGIKMGKGAFAIPRGDLEAIKMEEPPSAWEFYLIRQAKRRLGVQRPADSIVQAYEMHMFKDECYLVEEFRNQGTLLDFVNLARADASGGNVMDELLAMFFTIELLRTVEGLHSKGLLHGDIKSDNVLVRIAHADDDWSTQYSRDGKNGWSDRGITIIDFGRGIDMRVFKPDVQFIADWTPSEADCAEMHETRPWTYQIDYHGIACVIHNLLFGKYMEIVAERGTTLGAGQTKTYKIRESLKRYWETEIWAEAFSLFLNPLMHLEGEEGRKMPVLHGMRTLREKMETWLEANCEKGVGLKGLLRRFEVQIKERRK
ncbi:hypothetical protein EJ05DRAFT_469876 [Pseudovirgaria hyperparasitica]|uniref:Uncharacterized protein n=1 Tax=Pseudovirgaria hyperparasitica TaxID=470096 RepID=A0A6A6VTX8_9PEZI|nr:uncharacterized protein EJ05DRAFT_469876 [Pseudovirgaria hyperparasitica]KAF2753673.1 hypothetical protein EJ05DRAFT_469876 [Pseudovirgaria hyperparasitica]